jgi:hypothetical protein
MDFPLVVVVALRSGDFLQINQILEIKLPDLEIFSKSIKFSKSNYQIWRFSPNQSNSQILSITSKTHLVQVQKYPHLVFGCIDHCEQAPTSAPSMG